ncbi:helix-turn-helix transcriptional regulator [Streptomyces sp. NPDC006798]|uniref:helix-turn-helix domain-containing protein n=1 Tax=Streptomyces sp. NPDC006798 TaxID=3155462 RepID=UPI0033FC6CF7
MPSRKATSGRSQSPRQRFAEELRILRAERGETLRQLGDALGWDWALFGRLEKGESLGGADVAEALDQHYGTKGGLTALWELALADPGQFKPQYRRYMLLEALAVNMWHFAVGLLPGVLQTKEYATEVLTAGGLTGQDLDQQVEARVSRAELLTLDGETHFRTIISEAVLTTPLADQGAWRRQLEHLLAMSELPNVSVQVLRQASGIHGLTNTDTMFLRSPEDTTVAWVETGYAGYLVEDRPAVNRLWFAYDSVRDLALSPGESRTFILRKLEEMSCDTTSST